MGDDIKFSNDENRIIFENFYLSKGAKIVYQAPTDKQEFYFYDQELAFLTETALPHI